MVGTMAQIGARIRECGTLIGDAEDLVLRRDLGGRWRLDLAGVSEAPEQGRVCVTGVIVEDDLLAVIEFAPGDELGVAA